VRVNCRLLFAFAATILGISTFGCGSSGGPASPSPTPPPRALALTFASGSLLTVEVDEATGGLRTLGSSPGLGFRAIAADPLGRFVYLQIGADLVSYTLDKATGRVTERFRVQIEQNGRQDFNFDSFAASALQVHVLFELGLSSTVAEWVIFQVDQTSGALTRRACSSGCGIALPERGVFGPVFVVPDEPGRFVESGSREILTSQVQQDGSLADVSSRPLAFSPESSLVASAPGLIAFSDGLNVQAVMTDSNTGTTVPGPVVQQLLGDADVRAMAAASNGFVAILGPTRLRERTFAFEEPWTMETWRADGSGALRRQGAVVLPKSESRQAIFDPLGRFLYVTDYLNGLDSFAVGADGGLTPLAHYPQFQGGLVMVAP
jgi:hypothetical protein